jgi:hypothetical protein
VKIQTDVYWPWFTLIGCAVCVVVAVVCRRVGRGLS